MEKLKKFLVDNNLSHGQDVLDKFDSYYRLLIEWNEKINLTAIIQKDEVEIKHFIDSLYLAKYIDENFFVIDVGSGAGFPAIPIAIVRKDIKFVLLDSLNKRIVFLNEVISKLELTNVQTFHGRAEDFCIKNRERFDIATARAVAGLNTLLEYLVPFVKLGGKILALKGANFNEELIYAQNAAKILGAKQERIDEYFLDENENKRAIIAYKKTAKSPIIYPRGGNKPKSNPL